ncbi:TPA: hypothetical protein HA239_05320 [Candidatus Woesearchaeota archaeon]|nr:hypothetical protein QT06_C0001G0276 [archaeon GW2011_AR15]MBS3103926.1 hypothetical protein [Candidatus Woesearchaeota archaeon]HIH41802.1 hypothetical protein [Candidatus Woesearchaeota archaeon]
MTYTPDYAKGQVLVLFINPGTDRGFAEKFGKGLGYELSKEEYAHSNAPHFIYLTPEGEEQAAIDNFLNYAAFVESAELRDIKLEKRWESMGRLEELIGDYTEAAESDENYGKLLEEIHSSSEKLFSEFNSGAG